MKLVLTHDLAADCVRWHLTDGPIDHQDWTAIFKGDSFWHTVPVAVSSAKAFYDDAATRISKDGP